MVLMSGKELSRDVNASTKAGCEAFALKYSRKPCLAVILAGDDPASVTYVRNKKKACEETGIDHRDFTLASDINRKEFLTLIDNLNCDENVDGILVQMPLPGHIDENAVIDAILPSKDVDGFHPNNVGKLLLGQSSLIACTPKGILRLLDHYGIQTAGREICVIGRSNIVGKPMAALLMRKGRDATVTVCNSFTPDVSFYSKRADIVISAVGKPGYLKADMIKEGAAVIDVGINRVPDKTKKSGFALKGDADFDSVSLKAGAITPVPGGVGPMTIAMLLENTLAVASLRMKESHE